MSNSFICLFCNETNVEQRDWNKRCVKCREKQREKDVHEMQIIVGKSLPAARLVTEDGQEIWVDKFGREVTNPGYDIENDPRGWKYTGTEGKKRDTII